MVQGNDAWVNGVVNVMHDAWEVQRVMHDAWRGYERCRAWGARVQVCVVHVAVRRGVRWWACEWKGVRGGAKG
jgi:hypothetical protein